MSKAWIGIFGVTFVLHVLLIAIPVAHTLRATISVKSKLLWCGFLLFIPFLGAGVFHYKYRSSLFQGEIYERSSAEERSSSGTLSPDDRDCSKHQDRISDVQGQVLPFASMPCPLRSQTANNAPSAVAKIR